jgi:hypothetical protein
VDCGKGFAHHPENRKSADLVGGPQGGCRAIGDGLRRPCPWKGGPALRRCGLNVLGTLGVLTHLADTDLVLPFGATVERFCGRSHSTENTLVNRTLGAQPSATQAQPTMFRDCQMGAGHALPFRGLFTASPGVDLCREAREASLVCSTGKRAFGSRAAAAGQKPLFNRH